MHYIPEKRCYNPRVNIQQNSDKGNAMIVISDMMGTLTTGSPVLGFIDWVRHNQSQAQARWLTARMMPAYLLAKTGLIDVQRWKVQLMLASLGWIADVTPTKFEQVAEWTVEHNLWPQRRADVIARLQAHARQGAQVFIASSVYEPVAAAFGRRIGAQAIGTPVQIANGRATLASELVASEQKIQEVLRRLGITRLDYAYGDTEQDIPLLENAVHPVAVYPDRKLHTTALERGWEILGSRAGTVSFSPQDHPDPLAQDEEDIHSQDHHHRPVDPG